MSRRTHRRQYRRYPARIVPSRASTASRAYTASRASTASRPRTAARTPVEPWPVRAAFLSIAALLERIAAEIRALLRGK
jgi:hypothetical protein